MAGAPDRESESDPDEEIGSQEQTSSLIRIRRLAWIGWGALLLALVGLAAGLYALAKHPDFMGGSESGGPEVAASSPALPSAAEATRLPRDALPPSVRQYLDNTIYPPSTGRLTDAHGDLLNPNRRYEDFRPIPETFSPDPEEIISVRLTSDRYFYEGDDPIELSLAIRRGAGEIVEPLSLEAGATREGRRGPEGNRVEVRFRRERPSNDEDREAASPYLGEIDPARFADHHGPILGRAVLKFRDGRVIERTRAALSSGPHHGG